MAAKPEYKFKPYTPVNLKLPSTGVKETDAQIKALQSQRDNLDARLRAEGIDPDTLGGEFDNRNIIEKALNLTPDQGLLMDFFEIIDRPVQAIKQTIVAPSQGKNVLEGFWEGISGKEEVTGTEFLSGLGIETPTEGVAGFLTNVAVDIALDPLTYLPPGFIAGKMSALGRIGSRTTTQTIVKESLESAAVQTAKKFADDTLKSAQALVDDVASPINNLDDAVREVLKTSSTGSLRDVYYFDQQFDSVDDIVDYVKNGGSEYIFTATKPKKGTKTVLQKRIQQMQDILDGKYVPQGKGAAAELEAYTEVYKKIESMDPNLKVVLNKTADRYDDVAVYYKANINGKTALVKVQGIEVKDMVAELGKRKPAFFSNITFRAQDGKFAFGEGTTVSARVQSIMLDTFDAVKMNDGRTLSEYLAEAYQRIQRTKSTKGLGLTDIYKNTDDAGKKALRQMFEEVAQGSGFNYTYIKTGQGGKFIDVGENIDQFDEAFAVMYDKAQNQVRFKTGFDLKETADFTQIPDAQKKMLENFAGKAGGTETREVMITLAGRARAGEFGETVKAIANAVKKFEVNFKLNFNLTAGFSDETKDLIKRAYGENMFELERRSARLAEIKQQLIKVDPNAGEILGEVIEANARVVNGQIVKMKRRMGTSDFLDYVLKRTQDNLEIVLPSFPSEAAKQNFLRSLNDIYKRFDSTSDDFFEVVVGKNGGTVLKFDGNTDNIKGLIQFFNDKTVLGYADLPDYMQFGEKALSAKTRKFLLENADVVDEYKGLSDEILQELVDVAGFDNLPKELAGQIGYMRHIMSVEAFQGLQRQLPGVTSIFAKPGRDALTKRTFIGSADEINRAMRDFMGLDTNLFDPNAFNAMEDLIKVSQRKLDQYRVLDIIINNKGVNMEDLIKVVDNTQDVKAALSPYDTMFKSFKEEFGALYKNLSPSGKQRMDEFLAAAGYVDGKAIQMNKSAYNVLKGAEKAYVEVPQLVKTYDKFLNTWKGLTLITPGFHMRNLFGNMFNSYAVGMDLASQSKYLTTAVTELDQFSKIGKKLAQGADLTASEKELFDLVRGYFEQGVSQTHRGIRDLEQLMDSSARTIKRGKFQTGYNNAIRFNFNVAEKMDDIQRYALYRWGLDTTGDAAKAANKVSEALFDYSHLTPFEKDYMKRIFPFYTFMKNNFIFQAKNIFVNPKQYARVGRAYKYAMEDLAGYSPEDLPDYATENMWLPIPMTVNKNDKEAIAFLKATLPLSDFTELVENPFRKGVVSLTAPVKLLIEFGAGRDMFTGAPLQAFPGEKNAMEPGTGVLSGLRDSRGNLTIFQSPIAQKIMNDIGFRTPINLASVGVDFIDTLSGYQGGSEGLGDFMSRMGLVGIQEQERIDLTALYQDLEKLRELKKYYEQETGNQLPVLPR